MEFIYFLALISISLSTLNVVSILGTNSTNKGVEIGHSDDTGGEEDSFEPRDGNAKMFGSGLNNAGRQSGVFRGESQNGPSRSNSLMSENSSQPDMHPFYKVSSISIHTIVLCLMQRKTIK